ncbi:SRPBCC domain-containing protein [Streptomyces phaeochromogenes]|uniref:SRPBCC domain-containing protein n=1 Tax=Streptomyces phaeochromogenes TaxID=1923 RepID=UPI0022530192|nr:SRPBCC domain-containing protein [Streptomyces phaeochromogenes]MCX5605457.1 SRPBCC domain-containing protein [Streptomyces phaeochromogenes]
MEHEVFVPVPVESLREALADPARVARAVPGLQQDAGTPPVSGRLKVRVGGHAITYRGALTVTPQDDGTYAVEADATEARGSGTVKLALTLALRSREGDPSGSTVTFTGTASADGRVTELPADAVTSATTRLLSRFAEGLAVPDAGTAAGAAASGGEPRTPETPAPEAAASEPPPAEEPSPAEQTPDVEESPSDTEETSSIHEAEVPPPSLEPFAEEDFEGGFEDDAVPASDTPAEAAHARRTMIGRSAEEVDHAPPRGRYAPVPAPEATGPSAALRWAAPAAALLLASAVVLGRALRKRR